METTKPHRTFHLVWSVQMTMEVLDIKMYKCTACTCSEFGWEQTTCVCYTGHEVWAVNVQLNLHFQPTSHMVFAEWAVNYNQVPYMCFSASQLCLCLGCLAINVICQLRLLRKLPKCIENQWIKTKNLYNGFAGDESCCSDFSCTIQWSTLILL